MARTSMLRSWNSRATASMASMVGVTRTHPKAPTTPIMRCSRTPVPSRFPLAFGLMMTPMPAMPGSGRWTRHGELAAGRLDVLPAALADGRRQAVLAEQGLEAQHARARARSVRGARKRVPWDQVHLGA